MNAVFHKEYSIFVIITENQSYKRSDKEGNMQIPEIIQKGTRRVLMVDGKPFIVLAGEVHNSDSSSPEYMEGIWKIADELGMNTLLLPVTWEMTEPEEGVFDFSVPDRLIDQARERKMHIVFLWFGSWKNAECMYAPSWVKQDLKRFKRAQIVKGENKAGRQISASIPAKMPYTTISYLCEEAMQADAKAFARLMAHIREYDGHKSTVIAVQVENETGLLGAAREVSDEADAAFASNVPPEFAIYMKAHTDTMKPDIKAAVEAGKPEGSWSEVFGDCADEIFSAYYVSQYVEYVAAAGRKEYNLPMVANCWLVHKGDKPGNYPTGGPNTRDREVWDYNAPDIEACCPDIYVQEFMEVCDDYSADGRPLFIPEAATHSYCAPRMAYTIGHYHAMCYSPFGFDDIGKPFSGVQGYLFGMDVTDPALKTPQNYEEYGALGHILREAVPMLADAYGTDRLQAICAEQESINAAKLNLPEDMNPMAKMMAQRKAATVMKFGDLGITGSFGSMMRQRNDGVLLGVQVAENELYLIGEQVSIQLLSVNPEKKNVDILLLEEGHLENGTWIPGRRLNGDESAMLEINAPGILRLKWFTYA